MRFGARKTALNAINPTISGGMSAIGVSRSASQLSTTDPMKTGAQNKAAPTRVRPAGSRREQLLVSCADNTVVLPHHKRDQATPRRCSVATRRTVPELARITIDSVVTQPPRRRLTPARREPSVTPVAAKMQSPLAISSSA